MEVLFNATYDEGIFKNTVKEYKETGVITWKTRFKDIQPGDLVAVYYSNLPMETKGRILFKGEIADTGLELSEDRIFFNKGTKTYKACTIKNIKIVSLRDVEKYSLETLIEDYSIKSVQNQQYLWHDQNELKLALAAEEDLTDIDDAVEYFQQKTDQYNSNTYCACGKNHLTFIKADGTKYFEVHHLLPAHTKKLLGIPEEIVEDDRNKCKLCSNCHNQVHYGLNADKKALIDKMYKANMDWYDQAVEDKYTKGLGVKRLLYTLYGIDSTY